MDGSAKVCQLQSAPRQQQILWLQISVQNALHAHMTTLILIHCNAKHACLYLITPLIDQHLGIS